MITYDQFNLVYDNLALSYDGGTAVPPVTPNSQLQDVNYNTVGRPGSYVSTGLKTPVSKANP